MKKYKANLLKLKSNVLCRILLYMVLLVFGAMFVKFSTGAIAYCENTDISDVNSLKWQATLVEKNMSNNSSEDIIYVDLRKKEDKNISQDDFIKVDFQSFDDEYYEIQSSEGKYIIANLNTSDTYPDNWINNFNKKIVVLQKNFPSGKYWNHMGQEATNPEETNNIYSVTDIPCNHYENGEIYCNAHYGKSDELYPYKSTCSQCRGFASLLSDMIFGADAPVRYFENYDELRIGDQARIDGDYHTVFIIDKTDEYVIVAECNSDLQTCQINWGRKILRENMGGWYISRWSDERSEKINEN